MLVGVGLGCKSPRREAGQSKSPSPRFAARFSFKGEKMQLTKPVLKETKRALIAAVGSVFVGAMMLAVVGSVMFHVLLG